MLTTTRGTASLRTLLRSAWRESRTAKPMEFLTKLMSIWRLQGFVATKMMKKHKIKMKWPYLMSQITMYITKSLSFVLRNVSKFCHNVHLSKWFGDIPFNKVFWGKKDSPVTLAWEPVWGSSGLQTASARFRHTRLICSPVSCLLCRREMEKILTPNATHRKYFSPLIYLLYGRVHPLPNAQLLPWVYSPGSPSSHGKSRVHSDGPGMRL